MTAPPTQPLHWTPAAAHCGARLCCHALWSVLELGQGAADWVAGPWQVWLCVEGTAFDGLRGSENLPLAGQAVLADGTGDLQPATDVSWQCSQVLDLSFYSFSMWIPFFFFFFCTVCMLLVMFSCIFRGGNQVQDPIKSECYPIIDSCLLNSCFSCLSDWVHKHCIVSTVNWWGSSFIL